MTNKTKPKQRLRGATQPRLHSPYLKGKSLVKDVEDIAEMIGQPLLPWQKFVAKDMLTLDKTGAPIRKSSLVVIARQSGKSYFARMLCLAHLFKWPSKNILIMSSNRSMA